MKRSIKQRNDGGPAFSRPCVGSDQAGTVDIGAEGMSLLDYFAGQAMAGITARGCFTPNGVAESAYQYAHAMLSYKQNQQLAAESQQVALGIGKDFT